MSLQELLQFARSSYHNGVAFDAQKICSRNFASVRDNVSLVFPISVASTRFVRSSLPGYRVASPYLTFIGGFSVIIKNGSTELLANRTCREKKSKGQASTRQKKLRKG